MEGGQRRWSLVLEDDWALEDDWVGECKLQDWFLRIFAITMEKDLVVEKAYSVAGEERVWDVQLFRNLNDWEVDEYNEMLSRLSQYQIGYPAGSKSLEI